MKIDKEVLNRAANSVIDYTKTITVSSSTEFLKRVAISAADNAAYAVTLAPQLCHYIFSVFDRIGTMFNIVWDGDSEPEFRYNFAPLKVLGSFGKKNEDPEEQKIISRTRLVTYAAAVIMLPFSWMYAQIKSSGSDWDKTARLISPIANTVVDAFVPQYQAPEELLRATETVYKKVLAEIISGQKEITSAQTDRKTALEMELALINFEEKMPKEISADQWKNYNVDIMTYGVAAIINTASYQTIKFQADSDAIKKLILEEVEKQNSTANSQQSDWQNYVATRRQSAPKTLALD